MSEAEVSALAERVSNLQGTVSGLKAEVAALREAILGGVENSLLHRLNRMEWEQRQSKSVWASIAKWAGAVGASVAATWAAMKIR